jgi:hypothetical protein
MTARGFFAVLTVVPVSGTNEMLSDMAASRDKEFVVVEGATHNIEPCSECETRKGQFGNATKNFSDYVIRWIASRY